MALYGGLETHGLQGISKGRLILSWSHEDSKIEAEEVENQASQKSRQSIRDPPTTGQML